MNHGANVAGHSPPYVGALLRLCWQRVRARINEDVRAAGFTDLQDAYLLVFSYPLPNGVRPSQLARQIGMSRQATNHIISQMEALGYLERRAEGPGGRRLVYLAARGREISKLILACMRDLEAEWAAVVGVERFADFMHVLRALADQEPPPPDPSPT